MMGQKLTQFTAVHRAAFGPGRTLLDVVTLGPALRELLGPQNLVFSSLQKFDCIEVRANPENPLLTDILWEMASENGPARSVPTQWSKYFSSTLAALPLSRVVEMGATAPLIPESRPGMLWCVSNEPHQQRQLDFSKFRNVYDRLRLKWTAVRMEQCGVQPFGRLTWVEARADIIRRKPTVLLILAHGSSSPSASSGTSDRTKEPSILFRSTSSNEPDWVPVSTIAESVGCAGSVALVILLCCDLTRVGGQGANQKRAAYSAALEMAKHGAPEVVAMQAPIHIEAASAFLHGFLNSWLKDYHSSRATSWGRRAAVESLEPGYAWLPAFFCSESSQNTAQLSELAQKVQIAVSDPVHLPLPRASAIKRTLLTRCFCRKLSMVGVLRVLASAGAGCTDLFANALRSFREISHLRPALYFDCSRPGPKSGASDRVVTWMLELQRKHPVLFPAGTLQLVEEHFEALPSEKPFQLGQRIARAIDRAEITVVFDNIEFTTNEEDDDFWHGLMTEASAMLGGLVIAAGRLPHQAQKFGQFCRIPNLTKTEVAKILGAEAQSLSQNAANIYQSTDGNPRLLEQFLKVYKQSGETKAMQSLAAENEMFVGLLLKSLPSPARLLLYRLAASEWALPASAATDHVIWEQTEEARTGCLEAGALRENRVGSELWWSIPANIRIGLLNRKPAKVKDAAEEIYDRWFQAGAKIDVKVDELLRLPGGFNVVAHFAECNQLIGETNDAIEIATLAVQSSSPMTERYRLAIRASEWAVKANRGDSGIHLEAAELALWSGELERAKTFLDRVASNADVVIQTKAKLFRARWLKDSQQHSGVVEAEQALNEAESILNLQAESFGSPERVGFYRWQVRYERLRLALFFSRMPGADFNTLVDETIRLAPSEGEKARLLATLAEAEMQKDAKTDWRKVAEWCVEANSIAENPDSNCPDRSFCSYQYARYLEVGAKAQSEARDQYSKAEKFADTESQPGRAGLAIYRRIALEIRAIPDGEEDKRLFIERRLSQITSALEKIPTKDISALDCRVRVRLLDLAATLSSMQKISEQSQEYLENALKSASVPCLQAKSDLDRVITLLKRYLENARVLRDTFRKQQEVLGKLRFSIEVLSAKFGLNLQISVDRPTQTLRVLQDYCHNADTERTPA